MRLFLAVLALAGTLSTAHAQSASAWFDAQFCNTAGYLLTRISGTWQCSNRFPANIVWLGADPTGVADSSAVINNALALNQGIFVPCGTYNVGTTTIALAATNSISSPNVDCAGFRTASPNNDVITAAGSNLITDLTISSSVTRTGGHYLRVNGGGVRVKRFTMASPYNGILLTSGAAVSSLDHIYASDVKAGGVTIRLGDASGAPCAMMMSNMVLGTANAAHSHIYIEQMCDLILTNTHAIGANHGMVIGPLAAFNVAVSLDATNVFLDQNKLYNLLISAADGTGIARINFNTLWTYATGTTINNIRMLTAGSGFIDGVTIANLENYAVGGGGGSGVGVNLQTAGVRNVQITGGRSSANIQGIVADSIQGLGITNHRIGPSIGLGGNYVGVSLSNVNGAVIGANDLRGNTTNYWRGGGTDICLAGNIGVANGGCP